MTSNGDSIATSCKVVLLGESGVGKSCIIARFIHNSFSDIHISTKGANYAAKSMSFDEYDGKSLKFEIWDTAGQERFRSLNKIFYKDAAIAILVYDITRKDSFDEIKKYWYGALCNNAPKKIVFAIAANKNDLYEREEVNESEVREYAKEIGAIFKQTSASNAFGIDDLFRAVGKKYLDPNWNDEDLPQTSSIKINNETQKEKEKQKEAQKKKGCC